MNGWAEATLWCMVQVTLLCLVLVVVDRFTSWLMRTTGTAALTTGLALILLVTAVAITGLGHWSWWSLSVRPSLANQSLPEVTNWSPKAPSGHSPPTVGPDVRLSVVHQAKRESSSAVAGPATQSQPATWLTAIAAATSVIVAIAAAVGIVRLVQLLRTAHRYRREAARIVDPSLTHTRDALRGQMEIRHPVPLLESRKLRVPTTMGWWRPAILFPIEWRTWTPDERCAALAHELAHIQQRHHLGWLIGQFALACHFYHPLVHWLARRLRWEQEFAADASAASALRNRQYYAAALATLAQRLPPVSPSRAAPGLCMTSSQIARSIQMLELPDKVSRRTRRSILVGGLVVILTLGLAITGIRWPGNPRQLLSDDRPLATDGQRRLAVSEDPPAPAIERLEPSAGRPAPSIRNGRLARQLVDALASNPSASDRKSLLDLLRTIIDYPNETGPRDQAEALIRRLRSEHGHTHEVIALFRVAAREPVLLTEPEQPTDDRAYSRVCKTQLALLRSYFVLMAALRDPTINQLSAVASERDQIGWLRNRLQFQFPEAGEILQIRMTCHDDEIDDCIVLVDAVAEAYQSEVVFAERKKKLVQREELDSILGKFNEEIHEKLAEYYSFARELGSTASGANQALQQMALGSAQRIDDEMIRLRNELMELKVRQSEVAEPRLELRITAYGKRLAELQLQYDNLREEVSARSAESVELDARRRELDTLRQMAGQLATQIERLDVNLNAPPSIEWVQRASPARIGEDEDG